MVFRFPWRFALVAVLATCTSPVLADVRIHGVSKEIEANVRAHLRLDDEACDADAARIRYRYGAAERQILSALRPYGYYQATVQGTLDLEGDDCWEAEFTIVPGEPVLFSTIDVRVTGDGATLDGFQRILRRTEMKAGEPARHALFEKLKNQLIVLARELGFFEAAFSASELVVDPARRTADVTIVLDTGPRYRFGELHIQGATVKESLIRRYVEFQSGAPFERRYVRDLRNDLIQGGYFAAVDVRTEPHEDKSVDVYLEVTQARRIRYGIGFGFGTDTGFIVRFDAVNRRVNRSGHRLELDSEFAKVRQNATFDYRIPGKRPQTDWYSIYGGVNRQDSDAVESVALKLGLRNNRFHTAHWSSAPFIENVHEWFVQDGEWREKQALVPGYALI
ncbi:MAG: POTRA domain-containing protein, partial [Gammaproteobacteria bacterium]